MQLVDNDTFLKQLAALFESCKDQGSIWLTHKRLTHDGEDAAMKQEDTGTEDTREYPCLIRATDGGEVKLSTHVDSGKLEAFHTAYGSLLKSTMTAALRPRDKKREKQRAEQIAAKRKRMVDVIPIEGPKRGNGRRKRQRRVKAAMKQAVVREKDEGKTVPAAAVANS